MLIGIVSDLHLEFSPWSFTPRDDVYYVIAGDLHPSKQYRQAWLVSTFPRHNYFFVHGNHDYYGSKFPDSGDDLVNTTINGVKFAGATLWTDLSNYQDWYFYKTGLVDDEFIDGMNWDEYNNVHKVHKSFLLSSEADVIVSHHLPSYQSVHPRYKGSSLNPGFASHMDNDILYMNKPPKVWIHGHTHEEFDYMIGDTRVICHPRGYPNESKVDYQPRIIEV